MTLTLPFTSLNSLTKGECFVMDGLDGVVFRFVMIAGRRHTKKGQAVAKAVITGEHLSMNMYYYFRPDTLVERVAVKTTALRLPDSVQ